MRLSAVLVGWTFLVVAAASAGAQEPHALKRGSLPRSEPAEGQVTSPLLLRQSPEIHGLAGSVAAEDISIPPSVEVLLAPRSRWRYPVIGAIAGAVVGAAYGTYIVVSTENYLAPPAHFVTVPVGAAIGALLGLAANAIDPPH